MISREGPLHRALRALLASGLGLGGLAAAAAGGALELDDACQAPSTADACALSALQRAGSARPGPAALLQGDPELCGIPPIGLYVHHKTGTWLAEDAMKAMDRLLLASGCLPKVHYDWDTESIGNDTAPPKVGKCFVHLERDPFEIIVSGYRYHLGSKESWLFWESGHCSDVQGLCRSDPYANLAICHPQMGARYGEVYFGSLCAMWSSALVTAPQPDEGFQAYLSRVSVDVGLLANALWFQSSQFVKMEAMHDLAEAQSDCSENVCLPEFETACNATWHKALGKVSGASEPALTKLTEAAAMGCPEYDTQRLAKHDEGSEKKIRDVPPTLELMQRLRELDLKYLNGTIGALSEKLSCQGDKDYH